MADLGGGAPRLWQHIDIYVFPVVFSLLITGVSLCKRTSAIGPFEFHTNAAYDVLLTERASACLGHVTSRIIGSEVWRS